jgi:hypothetical protein
MFHEDFFRTGLFSHNQRTFTTAVHLAAAFRVEEDVQDKWRKV